MRYSQEKRRKVIKFTRFLDVIEIARVEIFDEQSMQAHGEKTGVNPTRQASPLLITPVSGSRTHGRPLCKTQNISSANEIAHWICRSNQVRLLQHKLISYLQSWYNIKYVNGFFYWDFHQSCIRLQTAAGDSNGQRSRDWRSQWLLWLSCVQHFALGISQW